MPQNDKIQSLYDDVKKDYEVGTLDDFKTYLSDDKKRAAFFKDVVQPNYEVKDISEFESIYDLKKKVDSTPNTSNGLENSSTQELGSSSKTKTVEEFNAKYGTNYTDLKTGQTKVDNAEKGVLVPFSPIKVKQPSGEKDFIAPKITLPDLTKAPMKRYEKAYEGITARIDNNSKEFEKLTAEAEKQGKEQEGVVNKYNAELKQASTVIGNELKAKYEGLLKARSISVEDANLKFKEEYQKGYDVAQKQITSKYKPILDNYTSLLDKRKTLGSSINGDIERAKLLSNSVGIIERNSNKQTISEYSNLSDIMNSSTAFLGSAMSGSLPFFLRFTNNNLAEYAAKNNMPELAKVAFEEQESIEKSELLQKMEAYAREQAQKGAYFSNKITEKEGTVVDNFSQGNYAQAGKVAGLRFLESIPMIGAAIGMTALTGGTVSAIIPGGFMFGSQNYYGEYADRTDMSETDKLNASFIKGSLEMITELSVMPLLSPLKSLIKTGGKEAVRAAVEKTLFNSIKEGYSKALPYFGWVQEGVSEYANEVGSTITDKIFDPRFQDKDWGQVMKEANLRGLEAFGPGAFGGATLTLPVAINNTINKYQNKKMAREFASELEKIEQDIANPNLTDEQKDILIARKQEIHGKLNKAFDADKQDTAGATTEQLSILDDINDRRDVIQNALLDETLTPESKKAFEEKAKELAEQEKTVLEEIKANEVVAENEIEKTIKSLPKEVFAEIDLALHKEGVAELIKEAKIEYVDEVTKQPCLRYGGRGNSFNRGSTWEIVKDLKGYKPHEKGGVDLSIGKNGVEIRNGKSKFYAKNGLLFSDGDPIEKRIAPSFSVKEGEKIKEHEKFLSDFIQSPKYKEMLLKQYDGDEKAASDSIKKRLEQLELTKYSNTLLDEKTGKYEKDRFKFSVTKNFSPEIAHTATSPELKKRINADVYLPSDAFTSSFDTSDDFIEDPTNFRNYPLNANVPTHEMTHRTLGEDGENLITPYAKEKIKNIMAGTRPFGETMGDEKGVNPDSDPTGIGAKNEKNNNYWQQPTEVLARLNSFRKLLSDNKVYDPNTESIDSEKYNLFKDKINNRYEELSNKNYNKLTKEEKAELDNIYDIQSSFKYINDSTDKKTPINTDKIMWMLNNLVKNESKGGDYNV
jgi:hypothetical protein